MKQIRIIHGYAEPLTDRVSQSSTSTTENLVQNIGAPELYVHAVLSVADGSEVAVNATYQPSQASGQWRWKRTLFSLSPAFQGHWKKGDEDEVRVSGLFELALDMIVLLSETPKCPASQEEWIATFDALNPDDRGPRIDNMTIKLTDDGRLSWAEGILGVTFNLRGKSIFADGVFESEEWQRVRPRLQAFDDADR